MFKLSHVEMNLFNNASVTSTMSKSPRVPQQKSGPT